MYATVDELLQLAHKCIGGQLEFHQSENHTFTGRIVKASLGNGGLRITLAYRARKSNDEWKLDHAQAEYTFNTNECVIFDIEEGVHQLVWRNNSLVFYLRERHASNVTYVDPARSGVRWT